MGSFVSLPVLVLAAVLQVALAPHISFLGGRPDFVFLLVIAWSLNTSLEQGVIWAFVGGLSKDLLSAAPLGTSVVGMILVIFAIHTLRRQIYRVGLFTLVWVMLLGTLFQQITIMAILFLTGFAPAMANRLGYGIVVQEISYIVLPTMVYNLIVIFPVYGFVRRLQRRVNISERLK